MKNAVMALFVTVAVASASMLARAQDRTKLAYPATKTGDVVDDYFGTKVPDPYRWLEDENSADTKAWVTAQNKVTFGYLDQIPFRAQLKTRLAALYNYTRYSAPTRRGNAIFFFKNDGLQNQSVLYIQQGMEGTPEVLLDPNTFSAGGTTRLGLLGYSGDGRYLGYGVSQGGSDWNDVYVLDVQTKKPLADHLQWVKVSDIAWAGNGFFYSRYPAPETGRELTTKNEDHQVFFHKVGTPQSADELVYQDKANPQRFHIVETTDDERFAVLEIEDRGKGKKGNALFYRDLKDTSRTFAPIVAEISDDTYSVITNVADKLLVFTNHQAPNGKVVLWDPKHPAEWKDVIPEKPEPLESVVAADGRLFASYLKDVATRASVFSTAGTLEGEIALPALGRAGFSGRMNDSLVFYTFTSFTFPSTIYRVDPATRRSTVFRQPQIPGFNASDYETKQVFFTSKDGTRVPMFLTYRKGLVLDGTNPTLLTGYGGFNITTAPSFNSLRLALLERGFVYASANMRGGGEYGEKWHEAGTKLKKQNVFDDFIAAAEYLERQHYTSRAKLAIIGASNGGLLVGAVANQRPELFKVVVEQAGVMDMLRFHKFTIGWNWIADYGSSENEAEFRALMAYSPVHNVKAGVKYPATLITTADHDDRVVPAHNFKYAAALQAAQAGDNPVLIRIETDSAHGASSTTKAIEEAADVYSFVLWNLGVTN
jgi:prolyl oligopeptidase